MTRSPGGSPSPRSPRPTLIESPARPLRRRFDVATLGFAVLASFVLLLGAAFLVGWKFQPIETASMEPRLPVGSLAVVGPLDATRVEPGMTIVFVDPQAPDRLVAHAVVKLLPGTSPAWQTKGDANAEPDPFPVHANAIQGQVLLGHPVGRSPRHSAARAASRSSSWSACHSRCSLASEVRDRRRRVRTADAGRRVIRHRSAAPGRGPDLPGRGDDPRCGRRRGQRQGPAGRPAGRRLRCWIVRDLRRFAPGPGHEHRPSSRRDRG